MSIAKKIKKKRKKLGLSQKEFAYALGLGPYDSKTIRKWENGKKQPSASRIKQILNFQETPVFPPIDKGQEDFTFIDLFSGIGGFRIPFHNLNGKCIFSSEIDKFARKTYRVNFGEKPQGDIKDIKGKDIPDHDILLGGFPCQPFSQAGLKKGFKDTRGTLFFEIEKIIKTKRPLAFVLENVKRLETHNKGKTFKVMRNNLSMLDYTVDYEVLRAGDFGLPQNRERLFIVGFNKDIMSINENFKFEFPSPPMTSTKVADILQENVDEKYTISDKLWKGHKRRKKENRKKGYGFGYSLFKPDDSYTSTLSARYYKDGSEILIYQGQNKNPRKLTPRECANLQGFPQDFIIPVSDTQAYQQFGNSVAIPVVRAIAKKVTKIIENIKQKQTSKDENLKLVKS